MRHWPSGLTRLSWNSECGSRTFWVVFNLFTIGRKFTYRIWAVGFMNPLISVGPGSAMEEVLIQSLIGKCCHQVVQVLESVTFVVAGLLQPVGIGLASASDSPVTSGCAVPSESASGHRRRAHHWISHYFLCGFAAVLWDNGLMCPLCPSC